MHLCLWCLSLHGSKVLVCGIIEGMFNLRTSTIQWEFLSSWKKGLWIDQHYNCYLWNPYITWGHWQATFDNNSYISNLNLLINTCQFCWPAGLTMITWRIFSTADVYDNTIFRAAVLLYVESLLSWTSCSSTIWTLREAPVRLRNWNLSFNLRGCWVGGSNLADGAFDKLLYMKGIGRSAWK